MENIGSLFSSSLSRVLAACVLWMLDTWADRKKASSWGYWYKDQFSRDGFPASIGWAAVSWSVGSMIIFMYYGLSYIDPYVNLATWVPILFFMLAVCGFAINMLMSLLAPEFRVSLVGDVIIVATSAFGTLLVQLIAKPAG